MISQERLAPHYVRLQGRPYLTVAGRLLLFRDARPNWCIRTEAHEIDVERGYAIFRAFIHDEAGRTVAAATNICRKSEFADYIEKAESSAIGRALILAGFGADAAGRDLDEGNRLADSPRPARGMAQGGPQWPGRRQGGNG